MPDATQSPGPAPTDLHTADICVVGGGLAGLCAAIAAARHGARVILLQDRPVLGGNASSEIRMWICGAKTKEAKETGILEEILLENCRRNPELTYPVWDTILYEKARYQPGLELVLNCAVCHVEMDTPSRIRAVRGWHLTRQRWLRVEARAFIDCSGDSILRLSGAPCRWGREARSEFGESHAPETADRQTMGNTLLIQLREIDPAEHEPFTPPAWAHVYTDEHPRVREHGTPTGHNFWWLEIGGTRDTLADGDAIRDELYRIAFGVWAYIKNHPDGRGRRWTLEWLGHLPGKRENVRYEGDHILRQQDVEDCGRFPDLVAHGGWPMDDHPPAAFEHEGEPTTYHPAPSPFGIPYRCLYSRAIDNLLFAGRNISCTHMALSATRVMATCATLGQAAGTAAALALRHDCTPRDVHDRHLLELQSTLLDDDQFLPGRRLPVSDLTRDAALTASQGDPEPLRDGIDRALDDQPHGWHGAPGEWIEYRFDAPRELHRVRLVGDSQLHRAKSMPCNWPKRRHRQDMPPCLVRDFRLEVQAADGAWTAAARIADNARRLVTVPIEGRWRAIRLVVERTWGGPAAHFFAFTLGAPVLSEPIPEAPWTARSIARTHAA
jgi:hypothetical protein